jgi:hypothetical protein
MLTVLHDHSFDYAGIHPTTAQFVQQQTGEIRSLMKRTAQYIVEIGQKLLLIKEKLGHGRFLEWLSAEFEWTDETARRFMNVAQRFGETPQIVAFAPSALYLLAAPSVPEIARTEAIRRAQAGETITHKLARQIKCRYTSTKKLPDATVLPSSPQPPDPPSSRQAILSSGMPWETHSTQEVIATSAVVIPVSKSARSRAPEQTTRKHNVIPQIKALTTGDWWQLAPGHTLYCGDPCSAEFQQRLPKAISLSLAFPLNLNWRLDLPCQSKASLALFSSYSDQDLKTLRELVHQALLLYSESDETVAFSYLPEPGLLLLADQLECCCVIAEPDVQRCVDVLTAWELIGRNVKLLR